MSRVAPFSAVVPALIACSASAALFYLCARPRVPHAPSYSRWFFALVLVTGSLVRWVLAWQASGNYDRESWEIVSEILARGGNVYAQTARYNSSPVWFWILGALRGISHAMPVFSFRVVVRLFLGVVDLATALLLGTWPRLSAWERARQAMYFYLNPVSMLLTGVHGQFDDLAVLFLVLALRAGARPVPGEHSGRSAWFLGTAGFVTKHLVFGQLLILLLHFFRRRSALFLFGLSSALFLSSFFPYWDGGREGILNVFRYRSYAMPYGLAVFGGIGWLSVVFAAALFVYPFFLKDRRLSTKMLAGSLFFLTFTTGFGVQYLVLPIAFGALRPTRGFFIYSSVAGCYLLGSYFILGIEAFAWVPLWGVWAAAAYWWASVHAQSARLKLLH